MRNKTDNKKKLEEPTLYDHDLLLRVMDGNIPLAQQRVHSYFRKRHLKVIHAECEVMMFNFQAGGKDCRLDIVAVDQNGKLLKDGSHIIYVNGEYLDLNTELGKWNHDLKCTKVEEIIENTVANHKTVF